MADFVTPFEEIIDRIKYMLEHLSITSAAFAEKTGIQPSTLSQILSGKINPSLENLNRISNAFPEWNKKWLFFGAPETPFLQNTSSPTLFSSEVFSAPSLSEEAISLHSTSVPDKTNPSEATTITIAPEELSTLIREAVEESREEKQKEIDEIRVFYTDGSFESFVRKKNL